MVATVKRINRMAEAETDKVTGFQGVTDDVELYALNKVRDAHLYAQAKSDEAHREMERYRKLYKGEVAGRAKNYNGTADLWPNELYQAIEVMGAQIDNAVYPSKNYFDVEAQSEGYEAQARNIRVLVKNEMIDGQFDVKRGIQREYKLKYGTSITRPYWNLERDLVMARNTQTDPAKKATYSLQEVTAHDHVDYEVINPMNFFPSDMKQPDINKHDFVGLTFQTSISALRRQEAKGKSYGMYRNLDLVKDLATSYLLSDSDPANPEIDGQRTKGLGQALTCAEYWFAPGLFDPFGDIENFTEAKFRAFSKKWGVSKSDLRGGFVITVVADEIPIRIQLNPYPMPGFPFIVSRLYRDDNAFWGWGITKLIEKELYEIADKHNQSMDALTWHIKPLIFALKGVIQRKGKKNVYKEHEPGDVIEVDDSIIPDIRAVMAEFRTTINPLLPLQGAQLISAEVQERTGAVDIIAGRNMTASESATSVQARTQGVGARVRLHAVNEEETFLIPVVKATYTLLQNFMDKPRSIRIAGPSGIEWLPVSPADLIQDIRFNAVGTSQVQNDIATRQQIIQMMGMPHLMPYMKPAGLAEETFRMMGLQHPEKCVNDPEAIPHIMTIEEQHQLFAQGQICHVDPKQSLQEQILEAMGHNQYMMDLAAAGELDPLEERRISDHIEEHRYSIQQQLAAQQALMMGGGQQPPMVGGPPQAPAPNSPQAQGTPGVAPQTEATGEIAKQGEMQPDKVTGPNSADIGGMGREGLV